MKLKKGDTVILFGGKDSGKSGKILKVFSLSKKIVVEGLQMVKKHNRPKKAGEKGTIVQIPMPISASKARLVCPRCGSATRVGYAIHEKTKVRVCKKCKQEFE